MIAVIYGTRPEAIKLAPVIAELRTRTDDVQAVCTGQHKELLDAVKLTPNFYLGLMEPGQAPLELLARMLPRLDDLFETSTPKFVLVQGDTTTAFAAAMVAFHRQIPVGHVEAGLRTYDLAQPFPEEGYRQLIDRISTRLYAPTPKAMDNLLCEGRSPDEILVTGNTGIDAALQGIDRGTPANVAGRFVLVTLHRREAFGTPLESVCRALLRVVRETDLRVVFPLHPNPNVRRTVLELLGNNLRIELIDPLPYLDLLATMQRAECVLTDSGGLQEEAPTFGVPVLVAREKTERPEGVATGLATLVGFDEDKITSALKRIYTEAAVRPERMRSNIYGDGHASERIASDVLNYLGES